MLRLAVPALLAALLGGPALADQAPVFGSRPLPPAVEMPDQTLAFHRGHGHGPRWAPPPPVYRHHAPPRRGGWWAPPPHRYGWVPPGHRGRPGGWDNDRRGWDNDRGHRGGRDDNDDHRWRPRR